MAAPDTIRGGLTPGAAADGRWATAVAAVFGALAGATALHATSVGWHLAAGRWILAHRSWLRADPFTFTAAGTPWVDHEWLFQVVLAVVDRVGGPSALVVLRMALTAALAVLLVSLSRRAGASPGLALAVTVVAVAGARMRFFLRPELVTLLVVPAVVALFLDRDRLGVRRTAFAVAALSVLGANCHAGIFAAPLLVAAALAGEVLARPFGPRLEAGGLGSGAAVLAAAALAPLVNPYGLDLYLVPVRLAELVGRPHIPNPEWLSPGLGAVPAFSLALALALPLLLLADRRPARWLVVAAAGAMALTHVRHVGLFFVLLPVAVVPALARATAGRPPRTRLAAALAVTAAAALVASWVAAPWPPFGLGPWAANNPVAASAFLESADLRRHPLYNDANFGGYLLGREWPPHPVFLDDRNEIHAELLAEIWRLLESSDVRGWQAMLERYGVRNALVRYHAPVAVSTPDGEPLGMRGFSALWFPSSRWALVYWDDVAMVLVDRRSADPRWLEALEYRVVRPDDGEELDRRLAAGSVDPGEVAREISRALRENPDSERALALSGLVAAHLRPRR